MNNYQIFLQWTGNKGSGTFDYRAYDRSYTLQAEGKSIIEGSSDPQFRGDKEKYNPEEMLLSAVASCHMLWFLHLCADDGIIVTEYTDTPTGTMTEDNGKGKFSEITLHPKVVVSEPHMIPKAQALHAKANTYCFIANSLNFKVQHQDTCISIT